MPTHACWYACIWWRTSLCVCTHAYMYMHMLRCLHTYTHTRHMYMYTASASIYSYCFDFLSTFSDNCLGDEQTRPVVVVDAVMTAANADVGTVARQLRWQVSVQRLLEALQLAAQTMWVICSLSCFSTSHSLHLARVTSFFSAIHHQSVIQYFTLYLKLTTS